MSKIMNFLGNWIMLLWGRLFSIQTQNARNEREPLTKLSIIIVFLLDIFLFSVIYGGISEQSQVIESPESYASYRCRETITTIRNLKENGNEVRIVSDIYGALSDTKSKMRSRSSSYNDSYSYGEYSYYGENTLSSYQNSKSLVCSNIGVILSRADQDTTLQSLYEKRADLTEKIKTNDEQANNLRNNYDTKLLEKIAGQDPNAAINPGTAATTKSNLETLAKEKTTLEADLKENTDAILGNKHIGEIITLVQNEGSSVLEAYDTLVFWYPVKIFTVQCLFLLPILLLVAFWSHRALSRNKPYQLLVASHLLAIIGVFIMLKFVEFIYDILPHKFIENLLLWLSSLQIIGVWYYFLIFASVIGTLGLVYFIQNRVRIAKEKQKSEIGLRRSEKGECFECGAKLPTGASHCNRCGTNQYTTCTSCKKPTIAS